MSELGMIPIQMICKSLMHSKTVCFKFASSMIGSYFFENGNGQAIRIYGGHGMSMTANSFLLELYNLDTNVMWFQQDVAKCNAVQIRVDHAISPR